MNILNKIKIFLKESTIWDKTNISFSEWKSKDGMWTVKWSAREQAYLIYKQDRFFKKTESKKIAENYLN